MNGNARDASVAAQYESLLFPPAGAPLRAASRKGKSSSGLKSPHFLIHSLSLFSEYRRRGRSPGAAAASCNIKFLDPAGPPPQPRRRRATGSNQHAMNPGSSRGPSCLSCFGRNLRSGRHRLMTVFLRGKQRDMEPKKEITMSFLTDDLVVEILSRLPLKSFCRFKCVCKSCLAFSSDPHHSQKLPRTPIGLLYQRCDYCSPIHLAGLPSSDREIDTALCFVPSYDHLRLMDCSNGLLLCCYEGFTAYFPDVSRSVVCNPATQEWMFLPPTQPGSDSDYHVMLCFDPLWSQHFFF
ncbi:hypothetical protein ACQ4PT_058962 [Festuca glaucescens]